MGTTIPHAIQLNSLLMDHFVPSEIFNFMYIFADIDYSPNDFNYHIQLCTIMDSVLENGKYILFYIFFFVFKYI